LLSDLDEGTRTGYLLSVKCLRKIAGFINRQSPNITNGQRAQYIETHMDDIA